MAAEVVIGDRGRLVLPAAIRAQLGLSAGSRLLLSWEADGSLRLRPYRAVADAGRGILSELGSGSMVDELLAERRAAAAAEDADLDDAGRQGAGE
jgi:AbrB family looped-hinge helix DNA binding protein